MTDKIAKIDITTLLRMAKIRANAKIKNVSYSKEKGRPTLTIEYSE